MCGMLSRLWRIVVLLLVCSPLVINAQRVADAGGIIAFARVEHGVSNIYLVQADGSFLRRIITDGREPSFSADGNTIYFVRGRDVYSSNIRGGNLKQLTHHGEGIVSAAPMASKDGGFVLYNSGTDVGSSLSDIRMVNLDGTNDHPVVTNAADPSFASVDGDVLFARGGDIYSMSCTASSCPSYLPCVLYPHDAETLVRSPLAGSAAFNGFIFAIRPKTLNAVWSINAVLYEKQRHEVTLANNASQPAFSPDGRHIAFVRNGVIYTMNTDGSSQAPLPITNDADADSHPSWGVEAP